MAPLKALYSNLQRVFRLRGACSAYWQASNGLLQGCPLSMLGLNALVGVILEVSSVSCPRLIARSYADDISATIVDESPEVILHNLSKFHRIVKSFEEIKFGEISAKKCFTFGHPSLKGKIDPAYEHRTAFRLVGGSFKTEGAPETEAALEQGRFGKWSDTVLKMRHCPLPWRDKARMLLASKGQATFGQGTHIFSISEPDLVKIRSNIMRAMFSTDFYSMNTHLTFALLLPPQLDPLFGYFYQGLRTLERCMRATPFRQDFKKLLLCKARNTIDGPARRVQRWLKGPFSPHIMQIMDGQVDNVELWAHQLRDTWRQELLRKAAKNRPQHYHDITDISFRRSMLFHNILDKRALEWEEEDTFMKLGVLRRLLVGGLLTEESDARHRKQAQTAKCPCGASPTIIHISWECPAYDACRAPIAHIDFQALPTCTQYSALIPDSLSLSDNQIITLQSTLVTIWQQYISDYKSGRRIEVVQKQASAQNDEAHDNGHVLKPRPGGQPGVFCCKCGKFVARSKHIRLKITSQPCPQKDSPIILEQEGFNRSTSRLDDLFKKLNDDYNSKSCHSLEWNRKIGKIAGSQDEGLLKCTACQRTWKWKDRRNIRTTRCSENQTNNPSSNTQSASSSHNPNPLSQQTVPRRRLYTKTKPSQIAADPSTAVSTTPTEAANWPPASASATGTTGTAVSYRTGIG